MMGIIILWAYCNKKRVTVSVELFLCTLIQ